MRTEMQSDLGKRSRATKGRLMASVAGLLVAGVAVLSAPALAIPLLNPTQATLVVGGGPNIDVQCQNDSLAPPDSKQAGGTSTLGIATATGGAMCGNAPSADVQGLYTLSAPATGTANLPFSAGCQSSNGQNGGSVTVPIGTSINSGAPVGVITVVSDPNTPVVFPGGVAATLNVVTPTPAGPNDTSVTRSAIVLTNGPTIGRVICGNAGVYPLAVDVSPGSAAAPALAAPAASGSASSGPGTTTLLLIGGFGLAVLAQVAVGRRMRHRRVDATS